MPALDLAAGRGIPARTVHVVAQRTIHDGERHERDTPGFMAAATEGPVLLVRGIS